jgi:hypothetical protein
MIKILLAVAVLVSVSRFAGLAMAQDQQGEAFGSEMSSQCAHRRVMAPNLRDGCVPRLRSDVQLGYGRGQLGYGRGLISYGQGLLNYGRAQLGYGQDQLGHGQDGASASNPDQRDEEQPRVQHEQPQTSTSPKIATAPAPKAKKANTPPRLAAQKEQQLYQEFLEWRNRRLFNE